MGTLPEKCPPPPPLRREVSVLAAAAAERRRWRHRFRSALRKTFGSLSVATEGVLPVLRKFEALPRRRQILLVLLPYVGALGLLLFWLGRSSAVELDSPAVDENRGAPPAPPVRAATADPVPIAAAAHDAPRRPADPRKDAPDPEPEEMLGTGTPSTGPRDRGPRLLGHVRVLPRASALYSRPSGDAKRAAFLRNGHVLTVFEDFPAPDGWILARSEKGTVGFVSALHLDGERDPRIDRRRRKRRRQR